MSRSFLEREELSTPLIVPFSSLLFVLNDFALLVNCLSMASVVYCITKSTDSNHISTLLVGLGHIVNLTCKPIISLLLHPILMNLFLYIVVLNGSIFWSHLVDIT